MMVYPYHQYIGTIAQTFIKLNDYNIIEAYPAVSYGEIHHHADSASIPLIRVTATASATTTTGIVFSQ